MYFTAGVANWYENKLERALDGINKLCQKYPCLSDFTMKLKDKDKKISHIFCICCP